MHLTSTFEPFLWCVVGFAGTGMCSLLVFGWLKGIRMEKEQMLRKR